MQLIPYDFDLFHSPLDHWRPFSNMRNSLSTDIIENDKELKIVMDIPGVKKENVKVTLEKGILTVSASTHGESEEKDNEGNYIRRERHSGEYTRSFSVSDDVSQDDIKAKMENGTLTLTIPKNVEKESSSKTIEIE